MKKKTIYQMLTNKENLSRLQKKQTKQRKNNNNIHGNIYNFFL